MSGHRLMSLFVADQAQLHDRYVVHYDSIASTAADPMTASSMDSSPQGNMGLNKTAWLQHGACLLGVIGNSCLLRDHVSRQTGRKVNVHEVKRRLIAGLDLLARH